MVSIVKSLSVAFLPVLCLHTMYAFFAHGLIAAYVS